MPAPYKGRAMAGRPFCCNAHDRAGPIAGPATTAPAHLPWDEKRALLLTSYFLFFCKAVKGRHYCFLSTHSTTVTFDTSGLQIYRNLFHTKQFRDTSCVSYSLIQFWPYLPADESQIPQGQGSCIQDCTSFLPTINFKCRLSPTFWPTINQRFSQSLIRFDKFVTDVHRTQKKFTY